MNEKNIAVNLADRANPSSNNAAKGATRRKFLAQAGVALTGGVILSKAPFASAQSDAPSTVAGVQLPARVDPRVQKSLTIRVGAATQEANIPVPPHTTNGDEARYPDESATYTKGILQDGIGLVN